MSKTGQFYTELAEKVSRITGVSVDLALDHLCGTRGCNESEIQAWVDQPDEPLWLGCPEWTQLDEEQRLAATMRKFLSDWADAPEDIADIDEGDIGSLFEEDIYGAEIDRDIINLLRKLANFYRVPMRDDLQPDNLLNATRKVTS